MSRYSASSYLDLEERALNLLNFPRLSSEADDSGRIQRAINRASSTGYSLYIPYGTYMAQGVTIPGNIAIISNGAIIKLAAANNNGILSLGSSSLYDVVLDGVTFDGNGQLSLSGGALVALRGIDHLSIRRCQFIHAGGNGLWIFNNCQNVNIEDNYFNNNLLNAVLVQGSSNGVTTAPSIEEVNALIRGNTIQNCNQQNGILVENGLSKIVISNNIIKNCGDEGIEVGGADGPFGTNDVTIIGNVIENVGQYNSNQSAGIFIRRSTSVTGSANRITGTSYHGVQVMNSNNVFMDGVLIDGATANTIDVDTSNDIKLSVKVNNGSTSATYRLYNATNTYIDVVDVSAVAQNISHDGTADATQTLVNNRLNMVAKITPVWSVQKWGVYFNIATEDGHYDSNIFDGNIVMNSRFFGNSQAGWTTAAGVTSSVSGGVATISSTSNYAAFFMELKQFAALYGNQVILEFDYETSNADSAVQIVSTNDTNTNSDLSYTLPASSASFSTVRKLFQISPFYPNLQIQFIPATNGGTGTLQVKNIKLVMPTCRETLGYLDKQLMHA